MRGGGGERGPNYVIRVAWLPKSIHNNAIGGSNREQVPVQGHCSKQLADVGMQLQVYIWGADFTKHVTADYLHALKGLALPRAELKRRDRPVALTLPATLAATPVLYVRAAETIEKPAVSPL